MRNSTINKKIRKTKALQVEAEEITEADISALAEVASAVFNKTALSQGLHKQVEECILPKFKGRYLPKDKMGGALAFVEMAESFGLDTQIPLHNSVYNGGMAMNMAKGLIREYNCKSTSDKATAQIVANSFTRIMEYSQALKPSRNNYVNPKLAGYYSVISKELDRAIRQYEAALNILIRMKSPALKINVSARNAFVAGNQQFNINKNKDENIEPK